MTDRNVNPSEAADSTSSGLIARAKTRDERAWGWLVDLYTPLVYLWCRQAGLQAEDAADVGQDVFRKVFQHLAEFRHDREGDTFRGWLRTITRNTLLDRARAARPGEVGVGGTRSDHLFLEIPEAGPDSSDESRGPTEKALLYRRALELLRNEFEERTWQAFWRVALEGQSAGEVARDLSLTRNAVYLAKSRVLCRLRQEFEGLVAF